MIYPKLNTFWWWVAGLTGLEILSWLAYTGPRAEQAVTLLATVILIGVAWKKPVWLGYASIAELVVGSKGYLLFLNIAGQEISIRMILFVLVVAIAIPRILSQWHELRRTVLSKPYLFFVGWLLISVVIAVLRQVPLTNIYTDANAFLYLALLPAWWALIRSDAQWRQRVLVILLAGATVIGFKSWLMVLLFGQDFQSIGQVYRWIRNTGVGEITYINTNVYRVFFQSQIYSVIALCITLMMYLRSQPPRWFLIPLAASALGVYISLSRSFWLGLTVGLFFLIVWMVRKRYWSTIARFWVFIPLGFFVWAIMVWALSWPAFDPSGGRANTVANRLQGTDSASAATSRANQIQPLFLAIAQHPVIGSGFGTTVTYYSTDPRTTGWRTTSAFELGYLDLWLKFGLVGLVAYAVWMIGLWRRISRTPWAGLFILSGLVVAVVHLTSPYLNHPLGLGWLMITSLYAYDPG